MTFPPIRTCPALKLSFILERCMYQQMFCSSAIWFEKLITYYFFVLLVTHKVPRPKNDFSECCGPETFDVTTQICCVDRFADGVDYKISPLVEGRTECCGLEPINTDNEQCCESKITYNIGKFHMIHFFATGEVHYGEYRWRKQTSLYARGTLQFTQNNFPCPPPQVFHNNVNRLTGIGCLYWETFWGAGGSRHYGPFCRYVRAGTCPVLCAWSKQAHYWRELLIKTTQKSPVCPVWHDLF